MLHAPPAKAGPSAVGLRAEHAAYNHAHSTPPDIAGSSRIWLQRQLLSCLHFCRNESHKVPTTTGTDPAACPAEGAVRPR
jgi:hypothetical protein